MYCAKFYFMSIISSPYKYPITIKMNKETGLNRYAQGHITKRQSHTLQPPQQSGLKKAVSH